jgi:hypothetical protein
MNLTDLFEGFDVRASGMPGNSRRKISASRKISKGGVLETVTEVSYTSPVMKNVYELRSNMKINEISPAMIRPIQAVKPGAPVKPGAAKPPTPDTAPVAGATPGAVAKPGAAPTTATASDKPMPVVKSGTASVALNPKLSQSLGIDPNKTIDAKILKVDPKGTTVELPKMPGMTKGVQLNLPAGEYELPVPTKLAMAAMKK